MRSASLMRWVYRFIRFGLPLLATLLATAFPAGATPGPGTGVAPVASTARGAELLDELLLKDGTLLKGTIIEESDTVIVIEIESLGRLRIDREQIVSLHPRGTPYGAVTDPDRNSILFCPTPETISRGKGYFRNFELFILNFGVGLNDRLDISLGTLFPISSETLLFSGGLKLMLVDRNAAALGVALTMNGTFHEGGQFYGLGGVIGVGNARHSLNLWINHFSNDEGDGETVFIIGADGQVTRRTKLFAEYGNGKSVFDQGDDFNGFINLGFRIFAPRMAFTLSGFRPLEDTGSMLFFPVAMFSAHW